MLQLLLSALQQALVFLPLVLGIYISYSILAVTDLTVDGTFVLGSAVFARLVSAGVDQWTSMVCAVLAGIIAGIIVTIMQRVARIDSLIASILAVFMLYSVNFDVMGQPNISLLQSNSILSALQNNHPLGLWLTLLFFIGILMLLIVLLLHSRAGLFLRAYGNNVGLLRSFGCSTNLMLAVGLGLANGLAALCGVMTAQINGYADINMGIGQALTAIGSVVIGLKLVHTLFYRRPQFNALVDGFACLLGSYIYFLALNLFLYIGINPINLKLVLGLLIVFFLATARYSRGQQEAFS